MSQKEMGEKNHQITNHAEFLDEAKQKPVQIKMNRKARRSMGKARMPWSKQVDSFLCLLNHNKYVKKKEGMEK